MTRSDRARWTRLGRIPARPFSSQTAGRGGFTNRSSATSLRATAGVFWWTQDGPFLEPPPGNIFHRKSTKPIYLWSYHSIYMSTRIYNKLLSLLDVYFLSQMITSVTRINPKRGHQYLTTLTPIYSRKMSLKSSDLNLRQQRKDPGIIKILSFSSSGQRKM